MDVFNFLYLFDSREEAFKVLDGETGQEIFKGLEKQEIETYGTFDLGFRSMTNSSRPIVHPEDAKVIRMRTLESSVCVDSLGELGIDAVSMSFGELFTALQTRVLSFPQVSVSSSTVQRQELLSVICLWQVSFREFSSVWCYVWLPTSCARNRDLSQAKELPQRKKFRHLRMPSWHC